VRASAGVLIRRLLDLARLQGTSHRAQRRDRGAELGVGGEAPCTFVAAWNKVMNPDRFDVVKK
jgi:hypothetical protein